jgi:hypothetical protein
MCPPRQSRSVQQNTYDRHVPLQSRSPSGQGGSVRPFVLARHFLRFFLFAIFLHFFAAASCAGIYRNPRAPASTPATARRREPAVVSVRATASKRDPSMGGSWQELSDNDPER